MKTILALLLASYSFFASAQDCTDYHTGTYLLIDTEGNVMPNYKLVFKNRKQIEYAGDHSTKSKMIWLDDCTYKVIIGKSDYLPVPKGTEMTCTIVRTFEGGLEVIATSEAVEGNVRMTFKKVD